ncbi:hypothetical protein AKO1_003693 [Acrasis kona]|uniref:NadR/Ttd14 AAA domain-containing protein n=1 Tax=Acrasis kona TaxID=1008807 RepID=A0AAW2Z6B4_9EUKA
MSGRIFNNTRTASKLFFNSHKSTFVKASKALFTLSVATPIIYQLYKSTKQNVEIHAEENHVNDQSVSTRLQKAGQAFNTEQETPIIRIVITGGPCAGKSSAMIKLSERLKSLGFEVFIVTEVATLLVTSGVRLNTPDATWEQMIQNESVLLRTKMALEDGLVDIAKASKKPTIILCDRGVMDSRAFLDDNSWHALLDMNTWTTTKLRDSRYDCVIHMVTAALGAEKHYTLTNNEARKESPEEAAEQDKRLRGAYVGHPNLYIVDNRSTVFEHKIQRVLDLVLHQVGQPRPINYRRKFLVKDADIHLEGNIPFQECEIEQVFLNSKSKNERTRIVKRGQLGVYNYTIYNTTISKDGNEEASVSRPISAKTYMSLMQQSDPDRVVTNKKLRSFVWENHYYELHMYQTPGHGQGVQVLSVEVEPSIFKEKGVDAMIPEFLKSTLDKDVTHSVYSSYDFAKRNKKNDV